MMNLNKLILVGFILYCEALCLTRPGFYHTIFYWFCSQEFEKGRKLEELQVEPGEYFLVAEKHYT